MTLYRVHFYTHKDSSVGFRWSRFPAAAQKLLEEFQAYTGSDYDSGRSRIESIEVDLSTSGILNLLNCYAKHPNNG